MRDMAKKHACDARRHAERMASDLDYRLRKLLNTVRARCVSGKGRKDWEWYGGKNLEVTLTVEQIKALWFRDRAGEMRLPDLDRKESSLGYTFDNCQFIEHADNLRKMIATRRKRRWYRKPISTNSNTPSRSGSPARIRIRRGFQTGRRSAAGEPGNP